MNLATIVQSIIIQQEKKISYVLLYNKDQTLIIRHQESTEFR